MACQKEPVGFAILLFVPYLALWGCEWLKSRWKSWREEELYQLLKESHGKMVRKSEHKFCKQVLDGNFKFPLRIRDTSERSHTDLLTLRTDWVKSSASFGNVSPVCENGYKRLILTPTQYQIDLSSL